MRFNVRHLGSMTAARSERRGVVLPAVLVTVVLLTLAAYEFSELMLAENRAAQSSLRAAQAHALADSGIHYVAALLSNPDAVTNTLNGNPYNNAAVFQGQMVQPSDQPRQQGRFSIISLLDPDDPAASGQPYRFGVVDESGRINLNALMAIDSSGQVAHDMLMTLPNMTEDVANAILDWIDPDDDPRPNGAENDYYSSLSPPYHCKNGPLDSLEELLLVKGVTPELLFGNDRNRNGILDPDEDGSQGGVDRGWSAYLTVYSRETNVDSQGNPRIYINDSDVQGLYDKLNTAVGPDLASYIVAYRLYGPSSPQTGAGDNGSASSGGSAGGSSTGSRPGSGGGTNAGTPAGGGGKTGSSGSSGSSSGGGSTQAPAGRLQRNMLDFNQARPRPISSLYELINSTVAISAGSGTAVTSSTTVAPNGRSAATTVTRTTISATTIYPSPLNDPSQLKQLLPLLIDGTTTSRAAELPARINVNTAPRSVLSALPGLTETDVQGILDHRPDPSAGTAPDAIFQTPAWLITEANLRPSALRTLERYVTARTQVYRVQSLGSFDGGGPAARVEAVIDTNGGRPRIVYYRDLTELGKGFDLTAP